MPVVSSGIAGVIVPLLLVRRVYPEVVYVDIDDIMDEYEKKKDIEKEVGQEFIDVGKFFEELFR